MIFFYYHTKTPRMSTLLLYLLLAVALLTVPSLRAVTLLGRRALVISGGCSLGGLARGGCGLALAVTLLLVVSARSIALVLLAVAATVATAVAALLLLVVAAAVALLAAVASSVATALTTTRMWMGSLSKWDNTFSKPANDCTRRNVEPNP